MVLTSLAPLSIALAEGVNDRDLVVAALLAAGVASEGAVSEIASGPPSGAMNKRSFVMDFPYDPEGPRPSIGL